MKQLSEKEILALHAALDHMLAVQRILTDCVNPATRRTFVFLAIAPGSSIGEIAKAIGVSDSIASRAVTVLVRRGLARVYIDEDSRRRHLVQLTADGLLAAQEVAKFVISMAQQMKKF